MSGVIKTGTSVQKSLSLGAPGVYTWNHNRGQKALAVRVYRASSGASVADPVVSQGDENSITLTYTGPSPTTVNVFVDWDVITLAANSLQPNDGFVLVT